MILSAQSLRGRIITPFEERTVHSESGMSYGLSSCGYDIRIREYIQVRPGVFTLASSLEHFDMPNDIVGVVADKSTLARMGIAVQNTVIEPGWRGYLTLEITNHGNRIIDMLAGSPIAQVLFHQLDSPTLQPYEGKYQNQPPKPVGPLRAT
jgi:dCTP deaminase